MKEVSFKTVVAQSDAEWDRSTRTMAVTEAVVRRVTREAEGDYYEHVPEEYRPFIDEMAVSNATSFEQLLEPDESQELREDIARGWLIRQGVMPHIMSEEGFQEVSTLPHELNHRDYNGSTIACVSGKGTLLMVGTGGLATFEGSGASLVWAPLPQREQEDKHVPNLEIGANVVGPPEHGKPWTVRYRLAEEPSPRGVHYEEAAPLVTIFTGPADAELKAIEDQVRVSNVQIKKMLRKGE